MVTSKQFLIIAGIILLVLGGLGLVLPEPTGDRSFLWFTAAENVAHLALGVVAIAAALVVPANLQRSLIILVGVVALVFGILGFLIAGRETPNLVAGANLENPVDNILHLLVGVVALAYAFLGRRVGAKEASKAG